MFSARLLACRHRVVGLVLGALLASSGCTGSRWARSNRDYAEKYDKHSDDVVQMGKQAVDARHVEGDGGYYAGVAARSDTPIAVGTQAGCFVYPPHLKGAVETRFGLAGLVAEGDYPVTGGFEVGARVQAPTRLAPFVGAGAYAGFVPEIFNTDDGVDNNGNGFVDEAFEENRAFVGALVPEAGAHFWVTPSWRLTASVAYYVTSNNDESAFPTLAISLAYLEAPRAPRASLVRGVADSTGDTREATPLVELTPSSETMVQQAYRDLDLSSPEGEPVRR